MAVQYHIVRHLLYAMLLGAFVTACGGSDTTQPPPSPDTTFTVSKSALNVTAALNHSAASISFSVTAHNVPKTGVRYKLSYSLNAIASRQVQAEAYGDSLQVTVNFTSPLTLGMGTFSDVMRVYVCYDQACENLVDGSPKEIPVTLTVGPPDAYVSTSAELISKNELITAFNDIQENFSLDLQGMGANPGYVTVTSTNIAIEKMDVNYGYGVATATLTFKKLTALGVGTYQDSINITACWDQECTIPLANSPKIIPVTLTITNAVAGVDGYTINVVPDVYVTTLANNTATGDIYAVTLSNSPTYSNSLVAIDPLSNSVKHAVNIGTGATLLKLSSDAAYAYVSFNDTGLIKRYILPGMTLDKTINLGTDVSTGTPLLAKDMEVSPFQATRIAVSRGTNSYLKNQISIYNNDAQTAELDDIYASELLWGDRDNILFAADNMYTPGNLTEFSVSSGSMVQTSVTPSVTQTKPMLLVDGLIYMDGGLVFDPASKTVLSSFLSGVGYNLFGGAVDSDKNRAYFLSGSFTQELEVFDLTSRRFLRGSFLEGGAIGNNAKLLRWGTDGLAYVEESGRVILINGPMVTN